MTTPRPWHFAWDAADPVHDDWFILGEKKMIVAAELSRADAALIVRAVNNYDALVEVARAAAQNPCRHYDSQKDCPVCAALSMLPKEVIK